MTFLKILEMSEGDKFLKKNFNGLSRIFLCKSVPLK